MQLLSETQVGKAIPERKLVKTRRYKHVFPILSILILFLIGCSPIKCNLVWKTRRNLDDLII